MERRLSRERVNVKFSLRIVLAPIAVLAVTLTEIFLSMLSAQPIGQLYQHPPAHASYVRIFNAAKLAVKVRLSPLNEMQPVILQPGRATPYFVVRAPGKVGLEINDRAAANQLLIAENRFGTLVLRGEQNAYSMKLIEETAAPLTGLEAEIRFYNFVDDCIAELRVLNGAVIFQDTPPFEVRRRNVNPVAASLVGSCASGNSAGTELPSLEAGMHYSLFLVGSSAQSRLMGQADETQRFEREPR